MAEEDFVVSIGADSTAFFAELKNLKRGIAKELNDGQLSVQFKNAMLGDLGRISKEAGQIKWDSVGTSLYKTLSSSIDEAFAPRKNSLIQTSGRDATTGRFQKSTTDIVAGDKEQQAAIVDSMRKRYALEDQLREGAIQGERNLAQQRIDVNRSEQRAIVQSMEMRFKAEDELNGKVAAQEKANQELINSYPRLRYAMYDVANVANRLSDATLGIAIAGVQAFAQYESAFTAVERTVGSDATVAQVSQLRTELLDLATQIPLAFGQITEIASLGAQLGVATKDIAGFADTVAKFSATTNVGTQAAAQSFGALGQLLNVSAEDYNKLGSAIAYAGVNAVATETEILSVTTAIAGVSANAGLSTEYVLGLATSLASLRVPAEQSRGALTRVFQEISRSAQAGGPALDEFARVIGTTRDEAQSLAATNMEGFFTRFLNGLSSMDASQLTQSLDAMNLSDIRVTNTLARLSDNMDVVSKSMADVTSSYAAGTQLNTAFGKVSDDLNSKLTILSSSFMELQAAAGASLGNALKPVIDFISQFIQKLSKIGETGVGQVILGISAAIMVLVGSLAAIASALAIGFGGFLALRTAWNGANTDGLRLNVTLKETISWLLRMPGATKPAELSMRGFGASMLGAAQSSKVLGTTMKGFGWMALIIAGIELATAAWEGYQKSQRTAAEKTAEVASAYFGEAAGNLSEAFQKDMKSGAEAIKEINTTITTSKTSAEGWVSGLEKATGAQVALNDATSNATTAIESQTIAYGENAKKALANILANNEKFQALFQDNGAIAATGASGADFAQAILGDPVAGGQKYIDSLIATIEAKAGGIDISRFIGSNDVWTQAGQDAADALGISFEAFQALTNGLKDLQDASAAASAEIATSASVAAAAAAANDALALSAEDAAASTNALKDEMSKYVDQLFQAANAAYDTYNSLADLGDALVSGGDAAAYAGGSLQAAIQAMIAEDPSTAAGRLQYLLDYIMANVPSAAGTIDYLQRAIAGLSNGKAVAPIAFNLTPFTNGMKKAGGAARSAAKEIRTLRDYANDLSKVFDRAFEIRFDGMSTLDSITKSFSSIAQATSDARDEIDSLNADIQTLQADQALQQYFLSVAEAYGDTLKAQEIRANLAKIDADLTAKTKSLQKAQDKTNKTLVGTSDAAIENRAQILDLVSSYQDHIKALAASGANEDTLRAKSAELKAEFMAQATQLGYNSDELGIYAAAFDDVATAIDNVPRNITVQVDPNPALTALNEIKKAAEAAGGAIGGMDSQMPDFDTGPARKLALQANIQYLTSYLASLKDSKNWRAGDTIRAELMLAQRNLAIGNYADGGYTGAGGKYDVAGIVHRGEYVVPKSQVNQTTGMPYFMSQPRSFAQGGYVGGNTGGGIVSLSPEDRALLRNVGGSGNIVLYADGKELARTVNDGNRQIVASGGRP